MAYTNALDVDVGDATKASDYDNLADNPEWLQSKADVDHDFDISTGTGYHKAEVGASNNPLHFTTGGSNHPNIVLGFWEPASGGGVYLLGKSGTAAFNRADADFWIQLNGDFTGVPAS